MPKRGLSRALSCIATLAASAAGAQAPVSIHIHSEHAMFQVLVSPGSVGTDDFVLQLMSGEGNLLQVKQVVLALSLPERGMKPVERTAALGADGYWHVDGVPIPSPGHWHLRIDAVTDFSKITLEDDFAVPAR